jgi:hypothetical protein
MLDAFLGHSCRENADAWLSVVLLRESGASSIPEASQMSTTVSGILDRPVPPTPKGFGAASISRARRSFSEGGEPGDDS